MKPLLSVLAVVASALLTTTSPALGQSSAPATQTAAPSFGKLDSLLTRLEQTQRAMGSVAVYQNGRVVYSRAIGFADAAKGKKATPETRYRVGSITKTFTAVMILQLVDEGKMGLDDTLNRYLPQVPHASKVTIRQLLNHHTGYHNVTRDPQYLSWNTKAQTQAQLLARIEGKPLEFTPGSKGEYSNTNYVLLGWVLEKVTGRSYSDNLQARITKPLKLERTTFGHDINTSKGEALSYEYTGGAWEAESVTHPSIPGAAGALVSTPSDLTVFYTSLNKLLKPATLTEMQTQKDGFGLGLFRFPFFSEHVYGHTGGIDGFTSMAVVTTDAQTAAAVCLNGGTFDKNELIVAAMSQATGKPYKAPRIKDQVKLPAEKLAKYPGTFSTSAMPLKLTISLEKGQLYGQLEGQPRFPLEPESETDFVFAAARVHIVYPDAAQGKYGDLELQQAGRTLVFERTE